MSSKYDSSDMSMAAGVSCFVTFMATFLLVVIGFHVFFAKEHWDMRTVRNQLVDRDLAAYELDKKTGETHFKLDLSKVGVVQSLSRDVWWKPYGTRRESDFLGDRPSEATGHLKPADVTLVRCPCDECNTSDKYKGQYWISQKRRVVVGNDNEILGLIDRQ